MRTRSMLSRAIKLIALVTGLPVGCEPPPPPSAFIVAEKPPQPPEAFNLTVAVTRGNHTYVPVNAFSYPPGFHVRLLELVEAFEQAHPELEVSCFNVEASETNFRNPYIHGLWLHHRPKPKS